MSLQRNYYEVLGVPQTATADQIKKKYRELARKFHPDVVQDKDLGQRVFSQINQAYRILADAERRAHYNSALTAADALRNSSSAMAQAAQQRRKDTKGAPMLMATGQLPMSMATGQHPRRRIVPHPPRRWRRSLGF